MPEDAERPTAARSTVVLLALGLIWLAAYLWAAHASIVGAGDDQLVAVFDAALALPGVVAATMLAGATASVTALGWPLLNRSGSGWATSAVALVSGLVIGGLAGGMILLGYGHRSSIMVLAWAVVAAGAVGGILGSARPREMTSAGLAATVAAFFVGFALSYKQDALLNLFGGGTTVQSRAAALNRLTPVESLVAGLLAGLVAFLYLRRVRSGLRFWMRFWAHLAGGAAPGIILLLAEAVTRLGGSQLFGAAGSDSVIDQAAVSYSSGSRLNHGLIVLFTGAFVALIAFGATLRSTTGPAGRRGTARGATGQRGGATRGTAAKDRAAKDRAAKERAAKERAAPETGTGKRAAGSGDRAVRTRHVPAEAAEVSSPANGAETAEV
jgi:hypothetical protein